MLTPQQVPKFHSVQRQTQQETFFEMKEVSNATFPHWRCSFLNSNSWSPIVECSIASLETRSVSRPVHRIQADESENNDLA
jgi:hypothetical protein